MANDYFLLHYYGLVSALNPTRELPFFFWTTRVDILIIEFLKLPHVPHFFSFFFQVFYFWNFKD